MLLIIASVGLLTTVFAARRGQAGSGAAAAAAVSRASHWRGLWGRDCLLWRIHLDSPDLLRPVVSSFRTLTLLLSQLRLQVEHFLYIQHDETTDINEAQCGNIS